MPENYTSYSGNGVTVIPGQNDSYPAAMNHGDFPVLSFNYSVPSPLPQTNIAMSTSFTAHLKPAVMIDRNAEAKFRRLARAWKEQTGHLSSVTARCTHPAYQQIIGMGETAIVFILRDLKKTREDWFWALTAITGDNPIPEKNAGRIKKMTEAWMRWGRAQGYDV